MSTSEKVLIELLKNSVTEEVGNIESLLPLSEDEWLTLIRQAMRNGVVGLIFDEINRMSEKGVDKALMPGYSIIGKLFRAQAKKKNKYKEQLNTAAYFADHLRKNGLEMMILKGISFSSYYKHPYRRECSDCDCFIIKKDKEGRMTRASEEGDEQANKYGAKVEFGTYKHSHIYIKDLMIENHKYLTSFNGTKQGIRTEKLLQKIIISEPGTQIGNTPLVRPCGLFNALFMLQHSLANFMHSGMSLRMIYDWAVFIREEGENIDKERLISYLRECRMLLFAEVLTNLCRKYLGTQWQLNVVNRTDIEQWTDIMLEDTLGGGCHLKEDESTWEKAIRIWRRYQRFWKFKAFATESIPRQVWNSFAFSSYLNRKIDIE